MIQSKVDESVAGIHKKMLANCRGEYLQLPAKGLSDSSVRAELVRYKRLESGDWKQGKLSGAIYHGGDDLNAIITESYGLFCLANPLHPEVFPGIRKMESEIIQMVLKMYNAPETACGSVTSGGTESLLMAIKTYRDMARELRGVTEPEMVVPVTIHAAVDKAAQYFGITLIHIDVDEKTGKVNLAKVRRAISPNTIMIAGSAPNFPHGIIDDIEELAKLAQRHKIGMHVDACLGGFLLPFMDKAFNGEFKQKFDFRVAGVTSISVDTHKYGFAPKGSSVIMYRSKEIRRFQYFVAPDWSGGVYASPSIAGSRPGALIAGCWTAMLKMGEEGYVMSTRDIVGAARKLIKELRKIAGIEIIGDPQLSVLAFRANRTTHPTLKTYAIADLISQRGWHLNILQFPEAIHIACTLLTVEAVDELSRDVKECVEMLLKNPELGKGDIAAIYGTAASVPDRSVIGDVSAGFLDGLTMV